MENKYIVIITGVVVNKEYYPGLVIQDGIDIDLVPQPCQPPESGLQQAIVHQKIGSEKFVFCKFNLGAVSDVRFYDDLDEIPDQFILLEPSEANPADPAA